ncbi:MAG: GNAT family N-acetyltransferase [Bryobacteraceae bacterium]
MPSGIRPALQAFFLRSGGPVSALGKALQRKSALQMRPGIDAFPVDLKPKSGGLALPKDVQAKMEKALGASFADVRVHVGPEASSIGAIAFTWGSDIHFAPGQYNPHTPQGQFLLGHELTHVVQQRAGRVSNPFGSGVAVVQDHALEAEADRLGRVAAMSCVPSVVASGVMPTGDREISSRGGVINQKPAVAVSYAVGPAMRDASGWQIDVATMERSERVGSVRITPHDKAVYISDLHVAAEHRRHGLATQLVQAAMRTARSQGYSTAQLEARPGSSSDLSRSSLVSMYQGLGFRATGLSPRGNPLLERTT